MADETSGSNAVELATELTIAWLSNPNNRVSADDVPAFLQKIHATVQSLSGGSAGDTPIETEVQYQPAVTARKSLASRDHIISMIDGKPYRTLRPHLSTHGLSPEDYRTRYGLKADYPMVAPSYSEQRSAMAKQIGLGNLRKGKAAAPAAAPKAPRGRKKAATERAAESEYGYVWGARPDIVGGAFTGSDLVREVRPCPDDRGSSTPLSHPRPRTNSAVPP